MKNILFVVAFVCVLLNVCSEVNSIYIDINRQALVSCNKTGLKRLTIENDSTTITLEGTESIIYFNQENNIAKVTFNDKTLDDYKLTLQENSNYRVTVENGYDRGPFIATFKTNKVGKIIETSNPNCN